MTKCCNNHDVCYDTCNKEKELCDLEFKRCLYKYCEGYTHTIGGISTVKGMFNDPVLFKDDNIKR